MLVVKFTGCFIKIKNVGQLLESVTVYKVDDIRFQFRDEIEIKG